MTVYNIYKIACNDLTVKDVYVGSTVNFIRRKYEHKRNCNVATSNRHNFKVYQTIRANGGWNNWTMVKIEEYNCFEKIDALARERYWYEQLKATMNTTYPGRDRKEHYENNKEQIVEYYKTHKERIAEKHKEYREKHKERITEKFNCDCGGKFTYCHRARHLRTKLHCSFLASVRNTKFKIST